MGIWSRLSCLLLAAPLAAQATLHVPQDYPAIQQAIAAAADGDTVLVAPGTYVEQIDFLGKAITVASSSGAKATTIDSQGAEGWPDFPQGTVVRMIQGEGAGSVLSGFTVTGVDQVGPSAIPGIWCSASPTIRDCIVTGNHGGGGGIRGNALVDHCTISNNTATPYGDGGGLYGRPTIVDSTITGNHSGGRGGGLYATGPCSVTNTVIDSNIAGTGTDGYTGGGVFGLATLVECQVTRNSAHHYLSGPGFFDELGTGVDGAAALYGCTVADNFIQGGALPGDTSGGIRNVGVVRDSILWGNEVSDVALSSLTTILYSIVGGGYPGTGNLAFNPLFADAAGGDYFLSPASPAIDAGDPAAALDPDGTRKDMGAKFFPQFAAATVLRNGTGFNPLCYSSILKPVIGSTWIASIDGTAHGFLASVNVIVGSFDPSPPILTPFGELLINPSPLILTSTAAVSGGLSVHSIPIPAVYSLGGVTVATQGVAIGSGVGLCNALDLKLGI